MFLAMIDNDENELVEVGLSQCGCLLTNPLSLVLAPGFFFFLVSLKKQAADEICLLAPASLFFSFEAWCLVVVLAGSFV